MCEGVLAKPGVSVLVFSVDKWMKEFSPRWWKSLVGPRSDKTVLSSCRDGK